jgi:hypothetical protein
MKTQILKAVKELEEKADLARLAGNYADMASYRFQAERVREQLIAVRE